MTARARTAVLGILLAAGAVGCGQQGPLVLPESARPAEPTDPPNPTEQTDDEQQDER